MHMYIEIVFFFPFFWHVHLPIGFIHWFLLCTSDFLVNIAKADLTLKDKELNTSLHLASSKVSWKPLCAFICINLCEYVCVFMLPSFFMQWKSGGQSCGGEGEVVPSFFSSIF